MVNKFRKRFPYYPDDADYTTNAPSYYDDLARKQKLIKLLAERILELSNDTEITIKQFHERLENIKEEMKGFFNQWLSDGVLDQIINQEILNQKANRTELTELENRLMNEINISIIEFSTNEPNNEKVEYWFEKIK